MNSIRETNLQIAAALNIPTDRLFGFDVRVRADEWPLVTLHKRFEGEANRCTLTLSPIEESFDIDRACREALNRVNQFIDASYVRAMVEFGWAKRSAPVASRHNG